MKVSASKGGLSVRLIAGTHIVLVAIDLADQLRPGCLGFSIQRTPLTFKKIPVPPPQQKSAWLFNTYRFPKDTSDADLTPSTMDRSPLQSFHYGDYGVYPGETYLYNIVAQYGQWDNLWPKIAVQLQVTTEDPTNPNTAVFFNRGAAASDAYNREFGPLDPDKLPADKQAKAQAWLSHGLEEAILAFLTQAKDSTYGLHAAIYEFQKPNLLQGLEDAIHRGVKVQVVYHHRKANPKDDTWKKNDAAVQAKGLEELAAVSKPRQANPQSAISHNKFVVLLQNDNPIAVWTGSTNWTEGAMYGQLNVGQAIYDPGVATLYNEYWKLLYADSAARPLKAANGKLTPVSARVPSHPGIWPIFSPQSDEKMLDLYAAVCSNARHLMVCAPFELAPQILATFKTNAASTILHFLLIDKDGSLGNAQSLRVIEGNAENEISVATTLTSPLHDYQNKLLEGKESYHHAGVHIHAKIIAADPLSSDPIIVLGSANFSNGSTMTNDSNSVIIRGNTAMADIYVTEFMRMFDHYLFRDKESKPDSPKIVGLKEDDSWSLPFYDTTSQQVQIRQLFAGTLPSPG